MIVRCMLGSPAVEVRKGPATSIAATRTGAVKFSKGRRSAWSSRVPPVRAAPRAPTSPTPSIAFCNQSTTPLSALGRRFARQPHVSADPWHLVGLAAIAPAWVKSLRAESSAKRVNRSDDYPPGLARAELRGMAAGPIAYLRARRASPPWRR